MNGEHKQRTVEDVLHFLTPEQMAREIVRLDAAMTEAYAEGRTDESKEMAGPLSLMRDAFDLLESHLGDSEVEYEDDEEEREYAPVQVAARYLMAAIQFVEGGRA